MISDTIRKIENKLQDNPLLSPKERTQLMGLLKSLKGEVQELSQSHPEQAESIASYTDISTHEATRQEKNPQLLEYSVGGLEASIQEFEATHPKLIQAVNAFCARLSGLGI